MSKENSFLKSDSINTQFSKFLHDAIHAPDEYRDPLRGVKSKVWHSIDEAPKSGVHLTGRDAMGYYYVIAWSDKDSAWHKVKQGVMRGRVNPVEFAYIN